MTTRPRAVQLEAVSCREGGSRDRAAEFYIRDMGGIQCLPTTGKGLRSSEVVVDSGSEIGIAGGGEPKKGFSPVAAGFRASEVIYGEGVFTGASERSETVRPSTEARPSIRTRRLDGQRKYCSREIHRYWVAPACKSGEVIW